MLMISEKFKWIAAELIASGLTLVGIAVGSSTHLGATFYLLSLIFWWWITFGKKMWGLVPLNGATTIIAFWHLFH